MAEYSQTSPISISSAFSFTRIKSVQIPQILKLRSNQITNKKASAIRDAAKRIFQSLSLTLTGLSM